MFMSHFDAQSGSLTGGLNAISTGNAPSFLAVNPSRQLLYAVNDVDGNLQSFKYDGQTGGVTHLNTVSNLGSETAHLALDNTGNWYI